MSIDTNQVLLNNATLEQIVQAISAKIEAKDLSYPEEELAAASKNIKTAISRINYAWNLQNSHIFRLPDHLILRIFEHLQGLAHETPSRTHPRWWEWLKITSVCRAWRRISIEGSSLWENVHILYRMPASFLGLIFDRAGGRQLALHFRSCDHFRFTKRRDDHLKAIQPIANRIKSLTVHVTASVQSWERVHLSNFFAIPYQDLESLDLSFNAFYASFSRRNQNQPLYRPDVSDTKETVILQLLALIPADRLKHLTLRHMKGWPPTRFGNLTDLTLFGYADGIALAEAVPANPALRRLKLESIKYKERYSWNSSRLVTLDGQTLELSRCEPDVLRMFALSSTCSLVITTTMGRSVLYNKEVLGLRWLPHDISTIQCLHELDEVHLSVTKTPRRRGWISAEQKAVGYSTSKLTSGTRPEPSVTFTIMHHFYVDDDKGYPFEPQYLLPYPVQWVKVTRASLDGFHGRFGFHDNVIFKTLPNLRSITLRRCDSGLVPLIAPAELRSLESLRFEDDLSGADFGDVLSMALQSRQLSSGQRLKELIIVTSGDLSSTITVEQMGKLKGFGDNVEVTTAPSYISVVR